MADAKGNQEPSMEEILASIRRIISEDGESKDDAAAPVANGHDANGEADDDDDDALVLTDMVVGESNVVELKEEAPETEPEPEVEPAAMPPLDVAIEEPAAPDPVEEMAAAEPPAEPAAQPQAAAPDFEAAESTPPKSQPPESAEPEMDVPEEIELDEEAADQPPAAPALGGEDGFPAVPDDASPGTAGEDPELVSANVAAASAATMAQLVAKKASSAVPRYQTLDGLLVETLVRQAVEPMLKDWLDEHLQEIVERLVRREVERLSRKAELS